MNSIVDKLDPYEIFINLFPGAFFGLGLRFFLNLELSAKNVGEDLIIYYFMGLIISRIGSLIVEPLLKKIGLLEFVPYHNFIKASKSNTKIEKLSEINNYMRSLLTCTLMLPAVGWLLKLSWIWPWFFHNRRWVLLIFILIIFLFSYRKQTNYIRKRVEDTLPPE